MDKIISIHATVSGKVQGVFYRKNTAIKAKSLGLTGWVKNNVDETVSLVACGDPEKINLLIAWLWQGPSMARVSDVSWHEIVVEDFEGFEVRL